jgi:SHS2 domain-containing protein
VATVSYRFVDHTAELQLEIDAPTRAAVFEHAVLALGELLGRDGGTEGTSRTRALSVEAGDDPALLAAWIDEIVFVAETEGLVPRRVERIDAGPSVVHALVSFTEGTPPHVIKGATYHDLELGRHGDTWRGRVVLDV